MQEVYNWISAVDIKDERQVNVRQFVRGGTCWIGDDGTEYDITQLDFTKKAEAPSFITEMNERMKRTDEEHDRTQAQLREMLASMDAKAIADHQAEVDTICDTGLHYHYEFKPIKKDGGISQNSVYPRGLELEWTGDIYESYKE